MSPRFATIIAAGVGRGGTIAAGEFLIDPIHLVQVVNAAHAAAGKKNMEFVLSTQIIDGQPGTPKMKPRHSSKLRAPLQT